MAQQRRHGRNVLGLLMAQRDPAAGCRTETVLTDIDTGVEYLVSQSLAAGSTACSADPQGFARASQVLRDAIERQPALVVCNRFGALEAENGGFVAELLALLEHGVPVLTVVAPRHFNAWQRFVGEAPLLPADPAVWAAWIDAVMQQRHTLGCVLDAAAGGMHAPARRRSLSRPVSDLPWIELTHPVRFIIGRLGDIDFPVCRYSYSYSYTGSARRGSRRASRAH